MANFTRTTLQTRGWTGLFIGIHPTSFCKTPAIIGLILVLRAGYFGVAYRQTSWTAAYFATLNDFQKASQTVIPDSWVNVQRVLNPFSFTFGESLTVFAQTIRSLREAWPPEFLVVFSTHPVM